MAPTVPEKPDGVKAIRWCVLKWAPSNGLKIPREIRGRGFPETEYFSGRNDPEVAKPGTMRLSRPSSP